jgi:hypothetical protein
MIRLVMIAVVLLAGCNKPTEESCREALANMQRLLGTENIHDDARMEGEVRRCKGGSTKKAVECAIKAQTMDELKACDFYKKHGKGFELPALPKTPAGSGSGAAGAAMGGAGATPGSGAGSAGSGTAGTAPGSAAGSGSAH